MFKTIIVGLMCFGLSALSAAEGDSPKDTMLQDTTPKANPLALMRADHIMISTADYRGTIEWYNSVLGFEVVREWDIEGYDDVDVGYIAANGFMIEVVGTATEFHLAFSSADVDAVAAELISRGVELELAPTNFDAAGVRLLFIRDNNGNLIEIVTPLSAYKD
jgi:methylmalonyl-CoA/ethylmalonyl-CoA epimerase